jgi:hypothetical protein
LRGMVSYQRAFVCRSRACRLRRREGTKGQEDALPLFDGAARAKSLRARRPTPSRAGGPSA